MKSHLKVANNYYDFGILTNYHTTFRMHHLSIWVVTRELTKLNLLQIIQIIAKLKIPSQVINKADAKTNRSYFLGPLYLGPIM